MAHLPRNLGACGVLLLQAATLAVAAEPAGTAVVYVGTYTDGASRGIYRFTLDLATGAASTPVLAGEAKNPSFLALHPSGRWLYAVGESDGFAGRKTGALSAFRITGPNGDLVLLNQQASEGTGPCHLIVDRAGRHVLVANYGAGTVAVLRITADGRLEPATSVRSHEGSGPNQERQRGPHAHGIYLDARERFALAPDLGSDRVFVYRFLADAGRLELHGSAALEPGAGPRHLAFDPSGQRAYVINELASSVSVFGYRAEQGELLALQTLSTLPAGDPGPNTAAEIAVSPDGRFVYGSNRGHDSLAIFAVGQDGRLAAVGSVKTGGRTPRHFALDASGRFLLVAHQGSDSVAVFRLDPATGMPGTSLATIAVPKPVCLVFAGVR